MNAEATLLSLLLAALSLAVFHSLVPDHWLPFAAVGRARGWSSARTARVTLLCGLGHLAATAVLALGALALGAAAVTAFGSRVTSASGLLLVASGLTYAAWRWHRRAAGHLEEAADDDPSRLTAGGLFILFALDPCVALIPLLLAAATLGAASAAAVALVYGAATLSTMTALAYSAHRGLGSWRPAFAGRWGDVLAGLMIAAVGLGVLFFGW